MVSETAEYPTSCKPPVLSAHQPDVFQTFQKKTMFLMLFNNFNLINSHVYDMFLSATQAYPTSSNGMQDGSSVGIRTRCMHRFFLHVWRPFACSVGAYRQKFSHRSSVGSLLSVRCWLGYEAIMKYLTSCVGRAHIY